MEEESVPLISREDRADSSLHRSELAHRLATYILPGVLFVVAVIEFVGPVISSYFTIETESLKLSDLAGKDILLSSLKVAVNPDGLRFSMVDAVEAPDVPYSSSGNMVFGNPYKGFDEYLVGVEYIVYAWRVVHSFGYICGGVTTVALIIQLIFRADPTTMAFKAGTTIREAWKGATPIWLTILGVFFGIGRVFASSSFIQSVAAQVAMYAVYVKSATHVEWQSFLDDLNDPLHPSYSLDVLRGMGKWMEKDGIKWGFATYFILIALVLKIIIVAGVFYLDTRVARLRLSLGSGGSPQLVTAMRQDMRRLPRHCQILPIWISISSLGTAITVTKVFGRIAFNRGRELSRLLWTSSVELDGYLLNDLISSHTNSIWLNPAKVVDVAVLLWIPIALTVIIGSINRLDGTSKLIELLGYGYWLRVVSIAFTSFPTPTTPLQLPTCYRTELMTFWEMVKEVEFCNDMIYSGHVTLAAIPCSILVLMIIYAPFERRWATISAIAIMGTFSALFVVIGRFHYTTDVLISIVVCSCLVLIHAPAWKILFSYRRIQTRVGTTNGVAKSIGQLEAINGVVEVSVKSTKISFDNTNWTAIEQKQNIIRAHLQKLQDSIVIE